MKNQVVLIYGLPASGKLTMAKRLQAAGGLLLDNHYFHDFVRPFIEVDDTEREKYSAEMYKLRIWFFDLLRKFYPKHKKVTYIATGVIAKWCEEALKEIEKLAADINADFIPIELLASQEVLKNRCQAESRKERGKVSTPEEMEATFKRCEYLPFEHPNKLTIDVSNLNEEETFRMIEKHLAKF